MENKKYPTDNQINYISGLLSSIDMYIKLIERPQQKPKDFILRDISIKEEFYKEVTTNQDTQKVIQLLTSILLTSKFLYESSRDRNIIGFKHIATIEKFKKQQLDNFGEFHDFKNNYIILCNYFNLIKYDVVEATILSNLRDK